MDLLIYRDLSIIFGLVVLLTGMQRGCKKHPGWDASLVPAEGFEPPTPALGRRRSFH